MTDILGPADAPNFTTSRPADDRAIGATDTWFKDCSSPTANDGTKVKSSWLNSAMGNWRSFVRMNGLTAGSVKIVTEDNADDMMVRAVQHLVQRGQPIYGVDTGSVNSLVVALTPALAEYKAGLRVLIKAANTNSGATVLNINSLGAKNVLRRDGSILKDSDIVAGAILEYCFDGVNFQLASAFGRVALTRNTDLYVNAAVGNDANDGTANISGKALATVQQAINIAFGYPPSQFTITVHVADGTYGPVATPQYAGPNIVIDGNATTPANVLISNPSGPAHCIAVSGPNTLTCKNFKVANAGTSSAGGFVAAGSGATLNTINTRSGVISTGAVFEAYGGASVNINGNHAFDGSAAEWFWAAFNGVLSIATGIVLTAAASIGTSATALAQQGGIITLGPPNASFAGSPLTAGARYSITTNGLINVNGGGANVFPGASAGTVTTGGQYT